MQATFPWLYIRGSDEDLDRRDSGELDRLEKSSIGASITAVTVKNMLNHLIPSLRI